MLGRLAPFLIALLAPVTAHAPVVEWRLEAVEFREVNLCLKECPMKMGIVTRYEWRSK